MIPNERSEALMAQIRADAERYGSRDDTPALPAQRVETPITATEREYAFSA